MQEPTAEILKANLDETNLQKLMALANPKLHDFVAEAIELCRPESVFVCTDAPEDIATVREMAVTLGEETPLNMEGHTIHFDGIKDQARDKDNTRYLLPPDANLGKRLNSIDRDEGLAEVKGFLKGATAGRQMIVRFFCLGPTNSEFSISACQVTDSFYVAHSEDLLYRPGYEQFKRIGDSPEFFRVLHSCGRVDEKMISIDVDKRRVYIDLQDEIVYSVNTQYAGNTVGFKKLSLRLAIAKADREGWLAEHMFLMGIHGPNDRVTYFSGAYPSACGKTSTAMMTGETIVGDDLAYLRKKNGAVCSANVECGIFGIIRDVNPDDDPVIHELLTNPGEVIFSNVLNVDGKPYWLGMGRDLPAEGVNFSGDWHEGKTDEDGNEIKAAHPNSRYTVRLAPLKNLDPLAEAPEGVELGGIIYGGRDSDASVPVQQAFDWDHGVMIGACLESETTSATLGQEGVRAFQPMSNIDFVAIPLGKYIQDHIDFIKDVEKVPCIFAANYFMKDRAGKYMTGMNDKRVWAKWMELRVHGEVDAIPAGTGLYPKYEDIKRLFREVLDKDYTAEQYEEQFMLRIPENLAKIDRMQKIFTDVEDTPQVILDLLARQRDRLEAIRAEHGDYVSPNALA